MRLSRLAHVVGTRDFALLAYLVHHHRSLKVLSTSAETGERLAGMFTQAFNVDVFVAPEVALAPMLLELNEATASLGWHWDTVKLPRHRIDALVLAVTLANGEKIALKSHLVNYPTAYTNYTVPLLRDRINALMHTTTITAQKIFIDPKFQIPFHVVTYPFIEGTLLSELEASEADRYLTLLADIFFDEGFSISGLADPKDVVIHRESGTPILTDWNKIIPYDTRSAKLPGFQRAPYYDYKIQLYK